MIEQIKSLTHDAILGLLDPLHVYIELKKAQQEIELSLEALREDAIKEASKYKDQEVYGAKVQVKNSAGRWKYDHIEEWQTYRNSMRSCEERLKNLYKSGVAVADSDTGELIELPIYEEGRETISITFNKTNNETSRTHS